MLSKEDKGTADFVVETSLSKAQLRRDERILIHPGVGRKEFKLGEPLMWPEFLKMLPTRMCELHDWYMKKFADQMVMFASRIQGGYLYQGIEDV